MELSLEAMNDRLIVRRIKDVELAKAAAESSIIIAPETAKEEPQLCEVVSAGAEVRGLMTRDKVVVQKYAGHEVTVQGEQYVVIRSTDVLAKVKGL